MSNSKTTITTEAETSRIARAKGATAKIGRAARKAAPAEAVSASPAPKAKRGKAVSPKAAAAPVVTEEVVPAPAQKAKRAKAASPKAAAAPVIPAEVEAVAAPKAKRGKAVSSTAAAAPVIPTEVVPAPAPKAKRGKAASPKAAAAPVVTAEVVPAPAPEAKRGKAASPKAVKLNEAVTSVSINPVSTWSPSSEEPAGEEGSAPKSKLDRAKGAKSRVGRNKPTKGPETDTGASGDGEMIALLESVEKPWSDLVVTALTEEEKKRQFKRAVGYLRYSTRGQSPNSLVRQAELIRQYAAAHGMTVVAIVSDIATSGTLEKRPGLDEGLVMLADKHADVLIGEDCDRFARKHSIFPNLFDKVNDLGGQLWTVSKGHIADGTTANLYGAIAAEDRLRTVSRLSAGLRVSINHGRRIPYLGYGYDPGAEKGLWQINEEEAGHIRKMFDMAETGVSHHYIAIVMNQQGLRTRKGHPWRSTTIRKMLCNPIFSGVYLFGRKGYRTTAGARPTLVVEFEQLAIISAKQFAAVAWRLSQRARERKVKNAPRVQYTAHFLDRRVTCDACDRHMYAKTRQSGPAYRRSLECRGGDGLFIAGHGLEEGIVRGAVLDCIERRLLTDEASELFDAERAARRERERRALGKEKISLSLQLQSAEAKADASFEDGWMIGASEDRRIRKRIELEEKVTEIRDLINQLRLREKALLAADENRETLAERFTRFREEGSSLSSQAAFELAHALRSVLVGVRVSFDRENGAYDLRIELAPDGGADLMGAAPQETVVEYRRIYRRILRDSGDEFLTRVRAALEAGWLSLSRQDYLRLVEAAPVLTTLPKSWPVETRINFIRGVLACALTGLAATALDDLVEAEGRRSRSGGIHQLRGGFERLAASGGVEQLRDALLALDIAGLPRIEGELMPDRHKLPIMTWLPEWDAPEWRSHDGSHAFSNDQGDVAPFVCDAPGMQTPEPCDGDSEVDERDVWALAAAGDDD